ncbi:hypothetical protein L218DRAFT_1008754 [Marasmius fiardii PR-910]|nr:hypothetical protein L218DRAFT_1008754 [Marasmius fiardii PR-910]
MATVWKIVDDTSSDITYFGNWAISSGDAQGHARSINSESLSGTVFNNTLHELQDVNGTFSFKFNGTSRIAVYASGVNNGTSPGDIRGDCTVDGESILSFIWNLHLGLSQVNAMICEGDYSQHLNGPIAPGEHTLSVNVTTHNDTRAYFDYILFETLPNAAVDGEKLEIGNSLFDAGKDPHLEFSPGWSVNTTTGRMSTSMPGANVTVRFNGTDLQLYGSLDDFKSNTATYQVDSQPPQPFPLLAPPLLAARRLTNQMLFDTSSLEPGEHSVVVTLTGQAENMPLALDWFQVTSLTAAEQLSLANQSPSTHSHHYPVGAIVGGVIGGLIVMVLGIIFLWIWIRRSQRRHRLLSTSDTISPFQSDEIIKPTTSSSTRHHGELNQIRFANLKLQQTLALSQPNHEAGPQPSTASPMIHTDSGWRMGNSNQGNARETPPVYTAT